MDCARRNSKTSMAIWLGAIMGLLLLSARPGLGQTLHPLSGIVIQWDVIKSADKEYQVSVNVTNGQRYTPIPKPGWAVSFDWKMEEVIFSIDNGMAQTLVDCSSSPAALDYPGQIDFAQTCATRPTIVDNGPRQGYLSAPAIDNANNSASFILHVGRSRNFFGHGNLTMPTNFSIGLAGHQCADPVVVAPRLVPVDSTSRQKYYSLVSYSIICGPTSATLTLPRCSVSFSAFFNKTVGTSLGCACGGCNGTAMPVAVASPQATSGCGVNSTSAPGPASQLLLVGSLGLPSSTPGPGSSSKPLAMESTCQDACGINIHVGIREEFSDSWELQVAVANRATVSFQPWLLGMDMPLLSYEAATFTVNYKRDQGTSLGLWYGKPYYNDNLLPSPGNMVWTILFNKTAPATSTATSQPGYSSSVLPSTITTPIDQVAFPRQVYFMGQACAMPDADHVPTNPTTTPASSGFRVQPAGMGGLAVALGVMVLLGAW